MDINHIRDEYYKQTIQLTNSEIVNVFDEEQFTDSVNQLLTVVNSNNMNEEVNPVSNTRLAIMFFTHKQQETLYRTFPLIVNKNKMRCYLNDIFIGIFDLNETKFIEGSMKYLLNPGAKALHSIPVTASILSNIGKHYVGSYVLGAENLKNPHVMPTSRPKLQSDTSTPETSATLDELMNMHKESATEQQAVREPTSFVEQQTSLTETTSDVVEKVKSGISSVAETIDSLSKKQNVYIIIERQYLSEDKAIQIYHIYSNKRLVASTLADEFAPILLSLLSVGQIKMKEIEEVVTQHGEWTAPKKL